MPIVNRPADQVKMGSLRRVKEKLKAGFGAAKTSKEFSSLASPTPNLENWPNAGLGSSSVVCDLPRH